MNRLMTELIICLKHQRSCPGLKRRGVGLDAPERNEVSGELLPDGDNGNGELPKANAIGLRDKSNVANEYLCAPPPDCVRDKVLFYLYRSPSSRGYRATGKA